MSKFCKYITILLIIELIIFFGNFSPVQAAPGITLNGMAVASGAYGDTVIVAGTDFTVGDSVTINYALTNTNTQTVVQTFTLTATTFSKTFTIPSSPVGQHTVTASISGASSTTAVLVVVPKLALSSTSGVTGKSLTVSGYGFGSGETNIVTTIEETKVGTAKTASSTGYWTNTFNIPSMASGTYKIKASGATNSAETEFEVIADPKISLNKTSGEVGSSVTVTGSGFAADEGEVHVIFNEERLGPTAKVNTNGGWSLTFTIPPVPADSYTIDAAGSATAADDVTDLVLTVTPSFNISPGGAPAGSSVNAKGEGFEANEEITVTYETTVNQSVTVASASADQNGSWSTEFTVPASSGGTHLVRAKGTATTVSPVKFKIGAGIIINKTCGKAGTVVSVSGSGFASNEPGIVLTYDGIQINQPVTASASGAWTSSFTVPAGAGGDHIISARGKTTGAESVVEVTFTIIPEVSADKTSGKAGTPVTITGAGFGANESGIVITYDDIPVGSTVAANDKGSWSMTIPIPVSASGTHSLMVNSQAASLLSLGEIRFKVSSGAVLNPTEGNVGSRVSITGSGFAANSDLTLYYDNNKLGTGSVSDEAGNCNLTFTVPKSAAGQHTVKVADKANNQSDAIFTMDSTAPAAPRAAIPSDGARIGLFGNINPTLEWTRVTDPSGISYILQIDAEAEFLSPLVEVNNISGARYTLSKSQTLPRGQFYWRVKAVDGASNESIWSEPLALQSGLISPLIFILCIILVLGALGIAIFTGLLPAIRKRRAENSLTAREIVIPEVINAEFQTMEAEENAKKRGMGLRLALPQAPPVKGTRGLSMEDQAKLKTIIDFVRSVPLVETGANIRWLIELAEENTGNVASAELYSQLVRGDLQIRYEPAWMRHPAYLDLQSLLEGQPILQDLNAFVDSVNHASSEASTILQDIYRDIASVVNLDIFDQGGWSYISSIMSDSFGWYMGKYLREPSERDYSIRTGAEAGLYGEPNSPFPGLLIRDADETEAAQLRTLHLQLRKNYRNNEKVKILASLITQLEVQRKRLQIGFAQFNRINPG